MTVAEADRGIPDVLPMPSLCARIRTNTHSPYSSPVPPVSAPYPFSNPPDKEDGECRRKTGIQREYGHRNHDAGDELHNSAKTAQETSSSRSSAHKRNVRIFPVRKHFAHEKRAVATTALQTVDKVLRETSVSRSIFLCVYEIYSENRKFSLGLCHP